MDGAFDIAAAAASEAPPPAAGAVRTTCPYCGVGCGVIVAADGRGGVTTTGDPDHPANFGRLCSKGSALFETIGLEGRLLEPMVDGRIATWDAALGAVADRLSAVIAAHGPEAVAFYLSGQLLTEDYYVANKLAKGFIGTPHVDTNSRLCMASSVAGHRRAFGADTVPQAYEDLDVADLIVLVGSNAAWCHPVLFQRIQANRARRGARVVNIDVRRTATSAGSDVDLTLAPGSDAALWCGLLVYLHAANALDHGFISAHVQGFEAALAAARDIAPDVAAVAIRTGLSPDSIADFYRLFADTERVVTCYSQGVNQSAQGTDKVAAILNVHLATARIGTPGCGPLSFTGQPNAMGGREVGGLANMLAAHMNFSDEERDRVRRFWAAPNLVTGEGLKAVQMFEAVADGRIKALWILHTNPAVTMPDADRIAAALGKLDLLVVSEAMAAPRTLAAAHVALPASAWGEKDGTVTNSERRISRQRPFRASPGRARPDWWPLAEVAKRLGYAGFDWDGPAAIFREHAALSAFENGGSRDFDLSGLTDLDDAGFDALEPVQWPIRRGETEGRARFFADGRFYHPDGRAKMWPVAEPKLAAPTGPTRPFRLDTGRVRDQWHTMTRTGLSPRLAGHATEAFVEINPDDARDAGVADGGLARVETDWGRATLRVIVTDDLPRGLLFAPFHWTEDGQSDARVDAVVHPFTCRISGQPELKATPAAITPVTAALEGLYLSRSPAPPDGVGYWSRRPVRGGFAFQIAIDDGDVAAVLDRLVGEGPRFIDAAHDLGRAARIADGRLDRIAYVGPRRMANGWVETMLALEALSPADRRALLAGRASDAPDPGPIVCACFAVGLNTILDAIAGLDAPTPEAIGAALKAGTNCGSCVPELKRIIAGARHG